MHERAADHFRAILDSLEGKLVEHQAPVHAMQDGANHSPSPTTALAKSDIALELRNRDRERKLIKKIDDEAIGRIEARVHGYWGAWRRDRPQAPRGAPDRDDVHRLQALEEDGPARSRSDGPHPGRRTGTDNKKGRQECVLFVGCARVAVGSAGEEQLRSL